MTKDYQSILSLSFEAFLISARRRKLLRKVLQECGIDPPLLDSSIESFEKLKASSLSTPASVASKEKNDVGKDEDKADSDDRSEPAEPYSASITRRDEEDELSQLEASDFFAPDEYLAERCRYYQEHNLPLSSSSFASSPASHSRSYPFIYRYKPAATATGEDDDHRERILIRIPLTEKEEEFRMEPSHPEESREKCKESATEVILLEDAHCYYQGRPVTKVLLKPLTGRRHQLRIHTLCLGHPIVGDFTYNRGYRERLYSTYHETLSELRGGSSSSHREEVGGREDEARDIAMLQERMEKAVCERMMLHAYSLKIPLSEEMKCSTSLRLQKVMKKEGEHGEAVEGVEGRQSSCYLVDVISPDPFPIIDRQLVPVLHANDFSVSEYNEDAIGGGDR